MAPRPARHLLPRRRQVAEHRPPCRPPHRLRSRSNPDPEPPRPEFRIAKTAITDYQAAHPNVTIKIEPVDNPVYLQRILTAAAAGTLPDIIYANQQVASMIESGTVFGDMPVDMFKDELANMVPAFSKLMSGKDGTQWLLPIFGGYHGWDYLVQDMAAGGLPNSRRRGLSSRTPARSSRPRIPAASSPVRD